MKKIILAAAAGSCLLGLMTAQAETREEPVRVEKEVQANLGWPLLPEDYVERDWSPRGKAFLEELFASDYVIRERGLYGTEEEKAGIPDDPNGPLALAETEAITLLTALLGADRHALFDDEELTAYARMAEAYYQAGTGESNFLNYQETPSRDQTFYEQVYPGLLYFMVMEDVQETPDSEAILKQIADTWREAVLDMGGDTRVADLSYTGYDFLAQTPYDDGKEIQPDAAAGIALLEYYAFKRFGDKKYMETVKLCLDYLEGLDGHPGGSLLYAYLPYLSARLNSEEGFTYNTTKFVEYFFTTAGEQGFLHEPQGLSGLFGNETEAGGTADLYQSLMAAAAFLPTLKFDQRYAREAGRYLLHLTQNLEGFFTDENWIPSAQLTREGPGPSLSLKGGAALGFFSAMLTPTDVNGVLKAHLDSTDAYDAVTSDHHHYLFFNPWKEAVTVTYEVRSEGRVALYDLVAQDYVGLNVRDTYDLHLPPEEAAVVVEIPLSEGDGLYEINRKKEKFVRASGDAAVNFRDLGRGQVLEGEVPVDLDIQLRGTIIETIAISVDGAEVSNSMTYDEPYVLDVGELERGYHTLEVELKTASGTTEHAYGLFFTGSAADTAGGYDWSAFGGAGPQDGQSLILAGPAGSGLVSPPFPMSFSHEPALGLTLDSHGVPWTLSLLDGETGMSYLLVENSRQWGRLEIDLASAMNELNPAAYRIYGQREVQLQLELVEGGQLEITDLNVFDQGVNVLKGKQWTTPFTPTAMTGWQSFEAGNGKLNYRDGKARVVSFDQIGGQGSIQTDYFEVDLSRTAYFTLKVADSSQMWSLLAYGEDDREPHYLQYPTHETGTFSYKLQDCLASVYSEAELQETKNIRFILTAHGQDQPVVEVDYLSLAYGRSWLQLASAGFLTVIMVTAICINLNQRQ